MLRDLNVGEMKFIVGGKREHFNECPNFLGLFCFSIHGLMGSIFMLENQREPNTDSVFLSASKCSFLSLGFNLWARVCSAKFPSPEIWFCRTGEPSVPAVHRFWHGGSRVLPTRAVKRCEGTRCKLRFSLAVLGFWKIACSGTEKRKRIHQLAATETEELSQSEDIKNRNRYAKTQGEVSQRDS